MKLFSIEWCYLELSAEFETHQDAIQLQRQDV